MSSNGSAAALKGAVLAFSADRPVHPPPIPAKPKPRTTTRGEGWPKTKPKPKPKPANNRSLFHFVAEGPGQTLSIKSSSSSMSLASASRKEIDMAKKKAEILPQNTILSSSTQAHYRSQSLSHSQSRPQDSTSLAALQAAAISTGSLLPSVIRTPLPRHASPRHASPARIALDSLRSTSPSPSVVTTTSMGSSLPCHRYMYPPGQTSTADVTSASLIAATVAVHRTASPGTRNGNSRMESPDGKNRPGSLVQGREGLMPFITSPLSPRGESGALPTAALINLFEARRPGALTDAVDSGDPIKRGPMTSHTPVHMQNLGPSYMRLEGIRTGNGSTNGEVADSQVQGIMAARQVSVSRSPRKEMVLGGNHEIGRSNMSRNTRPPTPPKSRTVVQVVRELAEAVDNDSSDDSFVSASSTRHSCETSPTPVILIKSLSFNSRPPPPPSLPLPQPNHRTALSVPSLHSSPASQVCVPYPVSASPTLSVTSLASAMFAGALATRRITPTATGSSSKSLPPPLPTQKPTAFPKTLREAGKNESSDENSASKRRRKKRLGAKGKHRHNEGSRKRWREEITERERKRYEALWASNRGRYLVDDVDGHIRGHDVNLSTSTSTSSFSNPQSPPPLSSDPADLVANVIVRELWRRSRLPVDELAEVWDLVDRQARGALDKQEFVVGMWLIDQRLRGRKIPQRVQGSVWGTARTVWGGRGHRGHYHHQHGHELVHEGHDETKKDNKGKLKR